MSVFSIVSQVHDYLLFRSLQQFAVAGNKLELSVAKSLLGVDGKEITFDFKWADNPSELEDPISLCLHGDTAPNRRFNYRFIWKK